MRAQRAQLNLRNQRNNEIPLVVSSGELNATQKKLKPNLRAISNVPFLKSGSHQQSSQIEINRYPVHCYRKNTQQRNSLDVHKSFELKAPKSNNFKKSYSRSKENMFPTKPVCGQLNCNQTSFINSNFQSASYYRRSNSCATRDSYSSNDSNLGESYDVRRTLPSIKRFFSRSLSSVSIKTKNQYSSKYTLFPEIRITPEAPCIDLAENLIWVAVEVTGVLREVQSSGKEFNKLRQDQESSVFRTQDVKKYGCLGSVHIHIKAGRGCLISDIIGNNHNSLTIGVNESHLVLVKIRIRAASTLLYSTESLGNLIEELQNDHGKIQSKYISVRVSFTHSDFNGIKFPNICIPGVNPQKTQVQTEVTGIISRVGPNSACSPDDKHLTIDIPRSKNPVLDLIETRLPASEAREASRLIVSSSKNLLPIKRCVDTEESNFLNESIKTSESDFNLDNFPLPPSNSSALDVTSQHDHYLDPHCDIWAQFDKVSPLAEARNLSNFNFSRKFGEKDARLNSGSTSDPSFENRLL